MSCPANTLDNDALTLIQALRDATQQTFDLDKVKAIVEKILNQSNRVDALLLGIDRWLETKKGEDLAGLSGAVWEHFREKVNSEKRLDEGKEKEERGAYAERRYLMQQSFIALMWPTGIYDVSKCGRVMMNNIYQCARRWPNFETELVPPANCILLLRHWMAIANMENAKINDYIGRPGILRNQEWRCLAQYAASSSAKIYGKEITRDLVASLQVDIDQWLESRDGSLLIHGRRLDDLRPDSTSFYFLEKGHNGLLQRVSCQPFAPGYTPSEAVFPSPLTSRLSSEGVETDRSSHDVESFPGSPTIRVRSGLLRSTPIELAGSPVVAIEALRIQTDGCHSEVNNDHDRWDMDSATTLCSTAETEQAWTVLPKHQKSPPTSVELATSTVSPESSSSVCTEDFEQETCIQIEPPNEYIAPHDDDQTIVIATVDRSLSGSDDGYLYNAEQEGPSLEACRDEDQSPASVERATPMSVSSIAEVVGDPGPPRTPDRYSILSRVLNGDSSALRITSRLTRPCLNGSNALPLTPSSMSISSRFHRPVSRLCLPPLSRLCGPSRIDRFAGTPSSSLEGTTLRPLTLGSQISSDGPLGIEESLLKRLGPDIETHLRLVKTEATVPSPSHLCKVRSNWLHGATQLATVYTPEGADLGRGTAASSGDADVCYFTAETFVGRILQGESFTCPVIIKEDFTDSKFLDVRLVLKALEDGYPTADVNVVMVHDDHTRELSMSEFVSHVRSGDKPLSAVDLSPAFREAFRAHEPTWTRVDRFSVSQTATARARSHPDQQTVGGTVDVAGCLTINHLATPGAFSGPRVTALGNTWMRNTTGLQLCLFVPKAEMEKSWSAFQEEGLDWNPHGKQRLLFWERDDVVLLPADLVHAVYSVQTAITVGGVVWDAGDIDAPLRSILRARQHPQSTNWRLPDGLSRVIDGLSTLLNDKPERFGCNTSESRTAFDDLIRDLLPSGNAHGTVGAARSVQVGDEPYTESPGRKRRRMEVRSRLVEEGQQARLAVC
ncbi:hypothetical protein LTR86_010398 [Recurvomyces mirabilis]|nr:hypothetical protein LTR86_010398 [Recurvomyces mirabilis]